jgi:hypothetical protein
MKNPFQYGGVVRGDSFCNRREEVEDLLRAMENGEKLFVYSESSIGFSKSGYRKHKVENSQGIVHGGTLMSSIKKLVLPRSIAPRA